MSSTATAPSRSPFRLFTSSEIPSGPPLALGRNHNSWFLVYAHPHGRTLEREALCLNYIIPTTPEHRYRSRRSVGTYSSKGQPRFIIGGTIGEKVLKTVLSLRDNKDLAPIEVRQDYSRHASHYEKAHKLCADVEVRIPESDVAQACAHCGRWETQYGPRFRCCGNCRKSYYCSKECQKADWKPAYHKGECALLKNGKLYEAEMRRPLHNNGRWFDNSSIGTKELLAGTGEVEFNRALDACDYLYLAYGQSTPRTTSRPSHALHRTHSAHPRPPPPTRTRARLTYLRASSRPETRTLTSTSSSPTASYLLTRLPSSSTLSAPSPL
ncbi:hypothetical protein C8Q80DRAFT_306107 [Daedaleopsis nitida]|nr:hypothetical protein C8Q80DRAFT_306107 [Daedaleopsis nitida]